MLIYCNLVPHSHLIPLSVKKNAYSPYCYSYISYEFSKENLSQHQDILPLVITSFFLITWMFEQILTT